MTTRVQRHVNGRWRQNAYILASDNGDAIIIDPGSDADGIKATLEQGGLRPLAIFNTHGHFDHIGAVADLVEEFAIPFYVHSGDVELLRRANLYRLVFDANQPVRVPEATHCLTTTSGVLELGPFKCGWMATPGHTKGSVCFLVDNLLFTGDTLFADSSGRTDLPGGNEAELRLSLQAIAELPHDRRLLPGHGRETSLGEALANQGLRQRT